MTSVWPAAMAIGLLMGSLGGCATQHLQAEPRRTEPSSGAGATSAAPVPPGASAATAARPHNPDRECVTSKLTLGQGLYVSPMTGEHAIVFPVTNVGTQPCSLSGYPGVTLLDQHGGVLPFRFTHGQSLYVTHTRPVPVLLRPGASAYFRVAKYRCDLGGDRDARTVQVSLGNDGATLIGRTGSGSEGLTYCLGGASDPGQVVDVSPVEATWVATQVGR